MGIDKIKLSSSAPSNDVILNKADIRKLQLDIISELLNKLRNDMAWYYGNQEYNLRKVSTFEEGITDVTTYIEALETCDIKIAYYNKLIKLLEEEI